MQAVDTARDGAGAATQSRLVSRVVDLAAALDHDVSFCAMPRVLDEPLQRFATAAMEANVSLTRACGAGTTLHGTLADLAHLPCFDAFADDAGFLAELFTDLTGCNALGIRLHALRAPMCPRFHTDRVGLRLLCTYAGPATEWLDDPQADRRLLGTGSAGPGDPLAALVPDAARIRRIDTGAVALLKGEAFPGNGGRGVIHRSPPEDTPRLLFSLDALADRARA